jgi:DNA-binding CsgD family transcriptional regulator/sugar-specific transcriptional regulator TrmB
MVNVGSEPQLFEAIGVGDTAATIYRLIVHEPKLTRRDLTERLVLSRPQVDRALAELRDVGLVQPSEPAASAAVVPIDPRVGLGGLVRSRRSQLERIAGLAEELAVDYREAQLRFDPGQLVEVLDGQTAIASRMAGLLEGAREEILNLYAPPLVNTDHLTGDDEGSKLSSGVRIRVIYAAESLRDDGMMATVLRDVASGEDARVLRNVPLKLLVVDRTWAILPLTSSQIGTSGSAVLVHRSRLTDALVSLFEALWEQASPITTVDELIESDGVVSGTPPDVQLLRLLAAGLKDETIARHLDVSERTLRRRVTTLLDRLGAASRFQAGIQAVRRGWL